jgi:UDP-glucose 4-epimerase
MAADVSIPYCIENPLNSYSNNLLSTLLILESARLSRNIERVIFSSTSAIYGLTENVSSESDKINCLNSYSHSKYAGEQLMKMYFDLYRVPTISFRYFNVYGNRQPTTGQYAPVIGIFSNQKNSGKKLTVTGDGMQTRDFVHVSDVVSANIIVAESDIDDGFGEVYNVGTGANYTIKKIANMIHNECEHIAPRIGESTFSCANISKIKSVFGWYPKVNLEEWLKENV